MKNSRTKNTILNAVSGMAVRMFGFLSTFITRTVFLYILGIEYAGVSSVFSDVLTVLSFAELGIGTAITYALYRPIAQNDEEQIARLMSVYRKIYSTIAGVIFVLGLGVLPLLQYVITDAPTIKEDIRLIYVLYLSNTAVSYLFIYKSTFLIAAQKDYLVSKYKIVVAAFKTVTECIILLVFRNFIAYLLLSIAFGFAQNVIIARVAEREYPILKCKSKGKLSKEEKKKLIADTKALALYKVSGTVLNGTDSIVTSSILGTATVGILGNYNLIANQVYYFVSTLFSATSASIGNLAATSDSEHQYRIFRRILFIGFWIYCFCATSLWTLLNPFMFVWQNGNHMFTTSVVALLVVEFYMKGMLSPISQFRTSNGLFIQGKYRPVIMSIINIATSIVLAKKIGIAGVILGTIISRLSTQIWYDPWLIFRKVFGRSVAGYYVTYIGYAVITALSCWLSSTLLSAVCPQGGILQVLVGMAICVIVPNCLVVSVFGKSAYFKETIQLIQNILKRKL